SGLEVRGGEVVRIVVQGPEGKVSSAQVSVRGIFHTGSQEFDSQAFRMPLALAQELLGTDRVASISIGLFNLDQWPNFAKEVNLRYPVLQAVPFDELDRVYYRHAVDWLDAQYAFIRGVIVIVVFLAIF